MYACNISKKVCLNTYYYIFVLNAQHDAEL